MGCRRRMLSRLRPYYRRRQLGKMKLQNDVDRLMELIECSARLSDFFCCDDHTYRCDAYARIARVLWGHRGRAMEWMLTLVDVCGEFEVLDFGFRRKLSEL